MVRRPAGLLRVVALLRSRLLQSVAKHHRRVEHERERAGCAARRCPPPLHHLPEQRVQERCKRGARSPQPAPERRRVRHPHPTEQTAHTPALGQRQVVEDAPAVEQQHDPHLDHEARSEEAPNAGRAPVDPRTKIQAVPQPTDHDQAASIGQVKRAVTKPQRRSAALYVGPGIDTMVAHRLGASRREDLLPGSPRNVRPQAVFFMPL